MPPDISSSPLDLAHVLELPDIHKLSFIELDGHAPFSVKRVYWVHSLSAGDRRGAHAHRTMQQLLIAISGSIAVKLDDGRRQRDFVLSSPTHALWVPAGVWRIIEALTDHTAFISLASTHYDEQDYIRDYSAFLEYRGLENRRRD